MVYESGAWRASEEFVNLLTEIFEQEEQDAATEGDVYDDVYYGVGNLIGVLDAQPAARARVPL